MFQEAKEAQMGTTKLWGWNEHYQCLIIGTDLDNDDDDNACFIYVVQIYILNLLLNLYVVKFTFMVWFIFEPSNG